MNGFQGSILLPVDAPFPLEDTLPQKELTDEYVVLRFVVMNILDYILGSKLQFGLFSPVKFLRLLLNFLLLCLLRKRTADQNLRSSNIFRTSKSYIQSYFCGLLQK